MSGSETVCRGNLLKTILVSVVITPAVVASNTSAEQTFTVNGLQTNWAIGGVSFQGAVTTLTDIVNARVSAANTVGLSFQNSTATAATPSGGVYLFEVDIPEAPANLPNVIT